MKNLFFIMLVLVAPECYSQQDTAISYTGIVNVNGVSKEELYIRARDWFSSNLQTMQIQDKETGELVVKVLLKERLRFVF